MADRSYSEPVAYRCFLAALGFGPAASAQTDLGASFERRCLLRGGSRGCKRV